MVSPLLAATISNKRETVSLFKPGSFGGPCIVCVFPLPVWPYAKMQTLYPSSTEVDSGAASSKTALCGSSAEKQRSYSKSLASETATGWS